MSKQTEDTFYEIHIELTKNKLWSKFDKQIKKMDTQKKHKWKTPAERWEYALNKIKE